MEKVIISKAKVKDIEQLIPLAISLTEHHNNLSKTKLKKYHQKLFKKCIYSANDLLLVAKFNDEIIGYLYGLVQRKPNHSIRKYDGHISQAFVQKKYRRLSILKKLTKELFSWFKSKKIGHVELAVYLDNQIGKKAWNKLGFKEYAYKCSKKI